jgi:hypothetical protein
MLPKPLRHRRPSQSAPSTVSLRRPLLHSPVQLPRLLPVRCSPSMVPQGRGPLCEVPTMPTLCCHVLAPLGRRSHRSTVVPRHHALDAAMPSRKLPGRARTHRWAAVPQGRGPHVRCASRPRRCFATGLQADSPHWPLFCFSIF